MRFAYADPPYLGLAVKFYGDRHPDAAVYDTVEGHRSLIARMSSDYDGWAYSLHTPALKDILPICPEGIRVGAWVKPFASFKPGVGVAYAWEPVIFWGGRKRTREQPTARDWCAVNIALERGFPGAKPRDFLAWVMDVLNVRPGDEMDDLFPGSGACTAYIAERLLQPIDAGELFS